MTSPLNEWYLATSADYAVGVRKELDARWNAWPLDLSQREIHEVIGGLLARQCSLAIGIGDNMGLWSPDLGELVLRAMADVHITMAWILRKPEERSRQFILHGLGQEKLILEQLKIRGVTDEETRPIRDWIDAQRFTWLTEVNVGTWSNLSIRDMADEAELSDFYRLKYQPMSTAAHSMWNHIERSNLQQCSNPLHRYHRIPIIRSYQPNIECWIHSAKMLAESFAIFDEKVGVTVAAVSAAIILDEALGQLTSDLP